FETQDYFRRSLNELNLVEPEPKIAIMLAYACDLAQRIIDGLLPPKDGVRSLYKICWAMKYPPELMVWLDLDDALDILLVGAFPNAYPDAALEDFDTVVRREAETFINEVCKQTAASRIARRRKEP